jgi:hypothetical protein
MSNQEKQTAKSILFLFLNQDKIKSLSFFYKTFNN